jgi:neopullulanase
MIKSLLRSTILLLILICSSNLQAKDVQIKRIDPTFWFVGMPNQSLELLVQHPEIGKAEVNINYPGISISSFESAPNANYMYLTLNIAPETKPGSFPIQFKIGKQKFHYSYELKSRRAQNTYAQGVNPADLIYLIMPDRFANGDQSNDIIKNTQEPSLNRDSMYYRHGGDLQGIINHLDYLQTIGITSLWLNPVLENDQPKTSYHGYANTDHFNIDPRFGNNELYVQLTTLLHQKGMKMIMDIVPNHIGNRHHLFLDLPSADWVNQWDSFTKTTYRAPTLLDPYVSNKDLKTFNDGWFDHHMPDLNQRNPHVARYLIQSYLWWVEYAGIDDFRIDTYAYPDQEFMSELGKELHATYPKMNFFGEIWEHGVTVQSFFAEGFRSRGDENSNLPGVIDFQVYNAINEALTKPFGWTDGVARLYYTFAKDILYTDAMRNVTFLDNHDLSRFYSVIGEDIRKYKMGIAFLLTTRGIPSIYYGTEILMTGFSNPDGLVRSDFSGGWPTDKLNKFTAAGRNENENVAVNYLSTLANWRKSSKAITEGKLMQFVPEKSLYVYFRYTSTEKVMVILNAANDAQTLDLQRFDEMIQGKSTGKEISSEVSVDLTKPLRLDAWSVQVIEIK